MEEFLEVLLKQKDRLIEDFRQQNTRLQEQNSQMTGRLEEYRGRSEALERNCSYRRQGKPCLLQNPFHYGHSVRGDTGKAGRRK